MRAARCRQRERRPDQPRSCRRRTRRGQVHDAHRRAAGHRQHQRAGSRHARGDHRRHPVGRATEHLHQLEGRLHRVRQRAAAGGGRKARPANQFRRHGILRPARTGGIASLRRRLLVDHHHRCTATHRRIHQRLRLRLLLSRRADGVADHRIRQARRGTAHRRRAGHRAGGLSCRLAQAGPGQVPRLQHRLRQPEVQADRCVGGAIAAGAGHRTTRRSNRDHREHLQPGQLRGVRGRQGEQAADRRTELGAGRGHRGRHLVAAVFRLGAA